MLPGPFKPHMLLRHDAFMHIIGSPLHIEKPYVEILRKNSVTRVSAYIGTPASPPGGNAIPQPQFSRSKNGDIPTSKASGVHRV